MMNIDQMLRLIYGRLDGWAKMLVRNLPNLVVALLVLLLFSFIAGIVRRAVVRVLSRISHNPALVNLSGTIAVLVVNSAGLFIALSVLGLDKTVMSLLTGAGIIALAIGFAFQDLTANFISGTIIAVQQPIQVGDVVETNGYLGRVLAIKLRSIVLDNFSGQTIEIPSKDVFQKPIINYSRSGFRRLELSFGISYIDDLNKAQLLAVKAVQALPFVRGDRPVEMHYKGFTLDMLPCFMWFWIDQTKTDPSQALSEAVKAVKQTFDENDILLMFPPHTFDLKKRKAAELAVGDRP